MSPTLAPELDPISTQQYEYVPAWTEVTDAEPEQWLEGAVKRVAALQRLPENWDSYGSGPATLPAIAAAVRVLYMAWMYSTVKQPPGIVPMGGGGMQVIWHGESRELEMDFYPDGSITVLKLQDDEPIGDDEPLTMGRDELEAVLSWL